MTKTSPQTIDFAIMRTILYADVFQFPLTLDEIQHYLIGDRFTTTEQIEFALNNSPYLQDKLCNQHGYYALATNQEYIDKRLETVQIIQQKWQHAQRYGEWFANLPYVRMVALTGAFAAQNPASSDDDFDYLIVAVPGRVWLARAFAIILVRLARLFRVSLCPNYVLSTEDLSQKRENIFMAREIAQMHPIHGILWYLAMRESNDWTRRFLPNATSPLYPFPNQVDRKTKRFFKQSLEFLFNGRLGDWLEKWEFQRKRKRFEPVAQKPEANAIVNKNQIKGHFQDHGSIILHAYQQRLETHGLLESYPLAGD